MSINRDRHIEIENEALRVLEAYDITKPVVNVIDIAKGQGIAIKEIKMPADYTGVAGFYNKDEKAIYINTEDTPTRKLFTIAHELGHVFLNHPKFAVLFRVPRQDAAYTDVEAEANSFAAKLLMPEFMLREYMDKYNLGRSDYKIMADIFGVPLSSMKVTLEFLK